MATRQTVGINTKSLPSTQELIALSARPNTSAQGIESFSQGVTGGVDLANKLADRQMARQAQMLAMQETIRKAKEEQAQKAREQAIAAELGGTTPAHTRVAARIGGQNILAKETKAFNDQAPVRLQTALASAEPLQTTKDILATQKEEAKSNRDFSEARTLAKDKFGYDADLERLKASLKDKKAGKIPVSLINDKNLILNQEQQLKEIEGLLTKSSQGAKGFARNLAAKVTLGNVAPELRLYEQNRPAIAVSIYRALTGDTRLSDADAKARALPLLPVPGEPAGVHQKKIAFLRDGIARRARVLSKVSEMAKAGDLGPEELTAMATLPLPTMTESAGAVDPSQFVEEE